MMPILEKRIVTYMSALFSFKDNDKWNEKPRLSGVRSVCWLADNCLGQYTHSRFGNS